MLATYIF